MTKSRVTQKDLEWWMEFAKTRKWTFAKTYAATAPHDYIVSGRTPGVSQEDLVRAARVIHTFGSPGKYYSVTKIYLVSRDGRYRWWTEDDKLTDTTLVNRATTDMAYGVQNAPSTISGRESAYDELASTWDSEHQVRAGDPEHFRRLLSKIRGKYPPHVLDIGCGTGRILDLALASPDRYAGVDSSRAMLNLLIRKHPKVAAIYPVDIRDALTVRTFTPGQFDWVFLDSSVELTADQRASVDAIARVAVICEDGDEWTVCDVSAHSVKRILAESASMNAGS